MLALARVLRVVKMSGRRRAGEHDYFENTSKSGGVKFVIIVIDARSFKERQSIREKVEMGSRTSFFMGLIQLARKIVT